MSATPQNRKADGRFLGGVSGNPGGRPKQVRELLELAREACPAAIELAKSYMGDAELDPRVRLEAAKLLMSYGLGKPPTLDGEAEVKSEAVAVPPSLAAKLAALDS